MKDHKFERVPPWVGKLAAKLTAKWHKELAEAGVTVDIVYCWNAMSKGGHEAMALTTVTPLLQRALGQADALMKLSGEHFAVMSEAEREALLDHELEHLQLHRDELGAPTKDDLDRPRLVIQGHDYVAEGFRKIAERHGKNSPEFALAEDVSPAWAQILLDFKEEPAEGTAAA